MPYISNIDDFGGDRLFPDFSFFKFIYNNIYFFCVYIYVNLNMRVDLCNPLNNQVTEQFHHP